MNCKSCNNGLDDFEKSLDYEQCMECAIKEGTMKSKEIYLEKQSFYLKKLHEAVRCCNFNGQARRELMDNFMEERVL